MFYRYWQDKDLDLGALLYSMFKGFGGGKALSRQYRFTS